MPGKASQADQAHQADRTGVQASQGQVRLAKQTRLIRHWSSGFSEPGKDDLASQAHQADRARVQAS